MLRRHHKKSRGGCLECKRRHVKCDEQRPTCFLCSVSERQCTYPAVPSLNNDGVSSTIKGNAHTSLDTASSTPEELPTVSSSSAASPSDYQSDTHSQNGALPEVGPFIVAGESAAQGLSSGETLFFLKVDDDDAPVNLRHAELIVHLMTDKDIRSLASDHSSFTDGLAVGLREGLRSPYLLCQLLAFSARHLAYLVDKAEQSTERSAQRSSPLGTTAAAYRRQADVLQTRAVSLFNAAWRAHGGVVGADNCVPVLLFSSILGHHLFVDSLARRQDDLDAFLTRYVQFVRMQRGVHTVAITTWPLLLESEFGPVLEWSARFTSRAPRGTDCQELLERIGDVPDDQLSEANKETCREAVRYLQVGFDALFASQRSQGNNREERREGDEEGGAGEAMDEDDFDEEAERSYRYQMVILWALLIPKEFTDLLAAKQPEALVVLAYYAWMLHHGRHLWQVGDAGAYILGLIGEHLGPGWDPWLAYPRHRAATDRVSASP